MAEISPELAARIEELRIKHEENPAKFFMSLANAYRQAGQLSEAESLLREHLKRHPGYLSAHVLLGGCLADRGAREEARNEFHYVLSIDPQNLIALRTLGDMAMAGGDREEARRWYSEWLGLDPMSGEARRAMEALDAPPAAAESVAEAPAESTWDPFGHGDVGDAAEAGTELAGESPPETEPAELDAGVLPELPAWEDGVAEPLDAGPEEWPTTPAPPAAEEWGAVLEAAAPGSGAAAEEESLSAAEPALPPDDEHPEVLTETMAELLYRQGHLDRAAEVYREILARGGDPSLSRRLAEIDAEMRGEGPAPEGAAAAGEPGAGWLDAVDAIAAGVVEGISTKGFEPQTIQAYMASLLSWRPGAAPEPAGESIPLAAAEPEAPADQVETGGWDVGAQAPAEDLSWGAAGEEPAGAPGESGTLSWGAAEEDATRPHESGDLTWGAAEEEATAAPPESPSWEAAEAEPTTGSAAAEDLSWGVAEEEAAPSAPAQDLPWDAGEEPASAAAEDLPWKGAEVPADEEAVATGEAAPWELAEPAAEAAAPPSPLPWDEETLSAPQQQPPLEEPWIAPAGAEVPLDSFAETFAQGFAGTDEEAAAPAAGTSPEPMPWEGVEMAQPASPVAAETPAPPAGAGGGFSFEDFFSEAPPAADPSPPAAEAASAPPAPAPAPEPQAPGKDEDEDLESFQAWLQSLKR